MEGIRSVILVPITGGLLAMGLMLSVCVANAAAPTPPAPTPDAAAADAQIQKNIQAIKTEIAGHYRRSIAFVIGIDKYQKMTPLKAAKNDALSMKAILEEHGFEVRMLLDEEATYTAIKRLLTTGIAKEISDQDRVFIYFAGHGISEENTGHFMPVDGDPEEPEVGGISMQWLTDYFRKTRRPKHLFFAADACYSGLAINTRGGFARGKTQGRISRLEAGQSPQVREPDLT